LPAGNGLEVRLAQLAVWEVLEKDKFPKPPVKLFHIKFLINLSSGKRPGISMATLSNQGERLEERVLKSHALLNSSAMPHSFPGLLPANSLEHPLIQPTVSQ